MIAIRGAPAASARCANGTCAKLAAPATAAAPPSSCLRLSSRVSARRALTASGVVPTASAIAWSAASLRTKWASPDPAIASPRGRPLVRRIMFRRSPRVNRSSGCFNEVAALVEHHAGAQRLAAEEARLHRAPDEHQHDTEDQGDRTYEEHATDAPVGRERHEPRRIAVLVVSGGLPVEPEAPDHREEQDRPAE